MLYIFIINKLKFEVMVLISKMFSNVLSDFKINALNIFINWTIDSGHEFNESKSVSDTV